MYVYAVTGFDDPDCTTDWEIYGIYTSREKAEDKMISIAHKRIEDLRERNRYCENSTMCWYNDEKLSAIYDEDNEFYFTIYKRELIGE